MKSKEDQQWESGPQKLLITVGKRNPQIGLQENILRLRKNPEKILRG